MCIKLIDRFYRNHCNDEWEHLYGITIETCDNPGWLVSISDPILYNKSIQCEYNHILNDIGCKYEVSITHVHIPQSSIYTIKFFGKSLEIVLNSTAELIKKLID